MIRVARHLAVMVILYTVATGAALAWEAHAYQSDAGLSPPRIQVRQNEATVDRLAHVRPATLALSLGGGIVPGA